MYVNELIGTIHSGGGHFFPFDFPSILWQNESISTVFLHSFVTYYYLGYYKLNINKNDTIVSGGMWLLLQKRGTIIEKLHFTITSKSSGPIL